MSNKLKPSYYVVKKSNGERININRFYGKSKSPNKSRTNMEVYLFKYYGKNWANYFEIKEE